MKDEIKEYNLRQIQLMEQKIKNYLEDKIYIIWLINDLYSLAHQIKKPPEKFISSFMKLWSDLEIPYACAKDENRTNFTSQEKLRINEGLMGISDLITSYKKQYLSDLNIDNA